MEIVKAYALSFLGKPYRWGKESPLVGFDCSGLVQEILRSCGMDPPGDQNSQALFNHFEKTGEWNRYSLGALAFYGESVTKITHVAFLLDQYQIIEAAGAGSNTASGPVEQGFVRIRPLNYRKDLVAVIKPRYAPIGVI